MKDISEFFTILSYLEKKPKKLMLKVPRLMLRAANGNGAKCGQKPNFILFLTETSWSINFLSHIFPLPMMMP